MSESKKILFFPGAFNPPHLGHACIIEMVLSKFKFDEVWIMPSGKRDNKIILTTYENRLTFGTLFVRYVQSRADIPVKLLTNDIENINGKRPHADIINEVLDTPAVDIRGLIGSDGFLDLYNKRAEAINKQKFLVIKRPGYDIPTDVSIPRTTTVLEDTSPDVSSTQIRTLAQKEDTQYKMLVPEAVGEYIEKYNPYKA